MDAVDDVDEDELALAMSTELACPPRNLSSRRARSFTSLQEAERQVPLSFIQHYSRRFNNSGGCLEELQPKPIKIHDRSLDDQDNDNPDGLWASSVTVTEPSIVKGNEGEGLQAVSGYVGKRSISGRCANARSLALYGRNIRGIIGVLESCLTTIGPDPENPQTIFGVFQPPPISLLSVPKIRKADTCFASQVCRL